MYSSHLNRLPIEYITLDATAPLMIVLLGFIQVFLHAVLGWDAKIYAFFLGSNSSSINDQANQKKKSNIKYEHTQAYSGLPTNHQSKESKDKKLKNIESICVCREDVGIVLKSIGLFSSSESSGEVNFEGILDSDAPCSLFEEEEASQEEVKAAFDLFDENKDGFIDAFELQRVLCALGFKEGFELDKCRRMIKLADENGDGRLDFDEFANFLEKCFC